MSFATNNTRRRIGIILPAYAEEKVLRSVVESLMRTLKQLEDRIEFSYCIVIDPAGDGTEEEAEALTAEYESVSAFVMSRRFGHQPAILAGIDLCGDVDAAIMMDSDGQHPPDVVVSLVREWEKGLQIVQTIRDDSNCPFLRRKFGAFFYRLVSLLARSEIKPGAADFRLVDRRVIEVLRNGIHEREIFLRGIIQWLGFRYGEISYVPADRSAGATKYSLRHLGRLTLLGLFNFSRLPLRLFALLGLAISILSTLLLIALLVTYFVSGGKSGVGWASLISVNVLFAGVQLCFLGIIGEYLGQVFFEVKRRPRYVIDREL